MTNNMTLFVGMIQLVPTYMKAISFQIDDIYFMLQCMKLKWNCFDLSGHISFATLICDPWFNLEIMNSITKKNRYKYHYEKRSIC